MKKCFKMPRVNKKNSLAYRIFFSHLNFSLSRKQRYEQKTTLFSLHSAFFSATKSLQFFLRVSFPASKCTPIKLIKKGLLQYSSSSRKKTAPQYNSNFLNCKKTTMSPITAAIASRLIIKDMFTMGLGNKPPLT